MSGPVHSFDAQNAASKTSSGDARTTAILRAYFGSPPDFVCDFSPRDRPFGHDINVRVWGDTYTIEEKRRATDYGDELLEDVSNDRTERRGWAWTIGGVDYLLNVYPKRESIWPGPALEAAWRQNRAAWISAKGTKSARNPGYNTISVPVATATLRAMLDAPRCIHCTGPVGRFRISCACCGVVSCCAIGDAKWFCKRCLDGGRAA